MGICMKVKLFASFVLTFSVLNLWSVCESWSYHHSNLTMAWQDARDWCRQHYTDLVAIQNKEEISYLNSNLPKLEKYYWIGIRKINSTWTWVGTNKKLTKEAENWAEREPNNKGNNQDCVEIYIKRSKDEGKWNDENCINKKNALCYTASCKNDSCAIGQGECVETINNHTCSCFNGFYGERCENVVQCESKEVKSLDYSNVLCSHRYGEFSYDSLCEYSCEEGYELKGSSTSRCSSTGEWSSKPPTCEPVQCPALKEVHKGTTHCNHPMGRFHYQSSCEFVCEEGYMLNDSSASTLVCGLTGQWNGSQPSCEFVKCEPGEVNPPDYGTIECTHPNGEFSYESQCEFSCTEGHKLKGSSTTRCSSTAEWSSKPPTCEVVKCEPGEVNPPDYGTIECTHPNGEFSYESQCEFSCVEGHKLKGSSTTRCSSTAEWSSKPPTCEVLQCLTLDKPLNGEIICLSSFRYGSECSFSCEKGFVLQGASKISLNGQMNCSSEALTFGTICTFRCLHGHKVDRNDSLMCGHNGRWSSEVPVCQAQPSHSPSLFKTTEVTLGIVGTVSSSSLFLAYWTLKKLKSKAKKFALNSTLDVEDPPQVYKSSVDSLI
ncbi:hypothetical protein DNTS_026546 [Danionella cerebrum]|uniref:E-selectin n=1 Tax=Danionella cerebrum TaxID=2873325 RepID=A0A553R9N4_9TELE|nr:hypothetical protein DNTS_026546 [Danionella translucida]